MSDQSDQRQHDRNDEYGQRPAETGTGTRTGTGMTQQPEFGDSSEQSVMETGTGTETGPKPHRTDTNTDADTERRAGRETTDRVTGGRRTDDRGRQGGRRGGQRTSGQQTSRQPTTGQQTGNRRMPDQQTGGQRMPDQSTGTRTQRMPSSPSQSRSRYQSQPQSQSQPQPQGMRGGFRGTETRSFDEHMTDELWIALEDFGELAHVAAWCAAQCATGDPELGPCARVCQDVAEIAALNELLIARDSMFGPEMADAFMRVADEALGTLRRYQQRHPHVLETAATIERTMNSCEALLRQVGGRSRAGGARTSERGRYGRETPGRAGSTGRQY